MNRINKESDLKEISRLMKDCEVDGYEIVGDPSGTYYFQKKDSNFHYYINPNFKEVGKYEVEVYWNDYFLKSLGEKTFKELKREDVESILSKSIEIVEKKSIEIKGNDGSKYLVPLVLKENFNRELKKSTDKESNLNFKEMFSKYLIN